MSVFDMFRKNAQPQPQPANPGTGNPHVDGNPTLPNPANTPKLKPTPTDPDPKSPNAEFAELWKIDPKQPNQAPNFNINPEQLSKVSSTMNFAKSVSKDDLSKIVQGGEEAVGALVNVLNSVGREIFSTNAQFSSHMTEAGYKTAQQSIDRGLPDLVKKQFTTNKLFESNPRLNDPALQPLVLAIQSQISQKYPNASSGEVTAMVDKYFTEVVAKSFGKAGSEIEDATGQPGKTNNYDFSSFLN